MFETLYKRKTVRTFTGEKISDDELQEILKSANSSPVGMGKYDSLHLSVVTNAQLLEKIDKAGAVMFGKPDIHPLYGAPMLVIVSSKNPSVGMENVAYSNCAIVAHNMALAGTALNVGVCYIWGATMAICNNSEILKELNLPKDFVPCCAVALGKTNQIYAERQIPMDRISSNYIF